MTLTIPVFSDSHQRSYYALEVFERLSACGGRAIDKALFLGDGLYDIGDYVPKDCTLLSVSGNCDLFSSLFGGDGEMIQPEILTEIGGLRIFMTHGHNYSVKGGHGAAVARARRLDADILLFGHTHSPFTDYLPPDGAFNKPLYVMNPGALRDGCFGVITISDGTPLLSLGKL